MKRRMHQARGLWLALFLGLGIVVAAVTVAMPVSSARAESAAAPAAAAAPLQKPDNSACLACHEKPGQSMTLPSGEVLSISVDPTSFDHSTHTNLACQTCHTNISGFPAPSQRRPGYAQLYLAV